METPIIISFMRSDLTKEPRERTPLRVAAAKRALKKEREKAGLFGEELMRFTSADERMDQMEQKSIEFAENIRTYDAHLWVKARKAFRLMPYESRCEIAQFWNESRMPKKAVFFADLIHQVKINPNYIEEKNIPWFPANWEETFARIDGNK